ncbi:MAG: hypothetical protein QNJ71_06070 [Acidimicrobiia bacterium]|nr:hypothetical protein [Acidimicrobiia bacterium]
MNVFLAIIIAVVALAILGFAVYALRSVGQSAAREAEARPASPSRPMPLVTDFHVKGETASVFFGVPLGEEEAGDHLTELLSASAVEYVREKVDDGLPLEGVHEIAVYATRNGEPVLLDTVDLPSVGELPAEAPILSRDPEAHDPIEALAAVQSDTSVRPPSDRGDRLEPVSELVVLSGPTEAHLRAIGIDTTSMSLDDLVLGLFRVSGYNVEVGRPGFTGMKSVDPADVFSASRSGSTSLVVVIEHVEGSYPELDDSVLSEFAVAVAQINPQRAMLITDKFGPYTIYERERRDKRTVFVTRERLQGFVDSFGLT